MAYDRPDFYTKITDRIIADLEKGVRPWMKPWDAAHLENPILRPLRQNGVPYQGINTVMLWWAALVKGYKCQYWFTFNQAKKLGGHIKKGETGETVIFASRVTKKSEVEGDDPTSFSMLKPYTVFNGDQCANLPAKYFEVAPAPVFSPKQRHEASEAFFVKTGALFVHRGNKAFYSPHGDFIQLPPFETFRDTESYAATKAHELIHWTLHAKRLNRDYGKRFGDDAYAREELVAEIGAAFLCADLGITPEVREDHIAYLATWLKVLKADKRAIFNAASQAQRAADYLHNLVNPKADEEDIEQENGSVINPIPLACCKNELTKISLVPPSDEALITLIETDAYLAEKLNQYYTGSGEGGLDTAEREELYDVIAQHFVGRSWPSNGEDQSTSNKFVSDFVDAAIKARWMTKG